MILRTFDSIETWKIERHKIRLSYFEGVHSSVSISMDTIINGNISVGENTYINNYGRIVSGENSKVQIGKNCAIGRFLSCSSRTHDLKCPTSTEEYNPHLRIEKDIIIGDNVWIGDKVTIKEGVMIDDYAVIGANSVVTKNVKKFEIVGGIPAKHIRYNTKHYLYNDYSKS